MPVKVDAPRSAMSVGSSADRSGPAAPLLIGLINNMPDSALEGTEAQFCSLLGAAAGRRAVRLRFFHLPEVPRGVATREALNERYWPIEQLLSTPLDALIVTGTEPRAPSLRDEPYWDRLVEVLKNFRSYGGKLKLSNLSNKVKSLFEITKLEKLFDIVDTQEEALTAF